MLAPRSVKLSPVNVARLCVVIGCVSPFLTGCAAQHHVSDVDRFYAAVDPNDPLLRHARETDPHRQIASTAGSSWMDKVPLVAPLPFPWSKKAPAAAPDGIAEGEKPPVPDVPPHGGRGPDFEENKPYPHPPPAADEPAFRGKPDFGAQFARKGDAAAGATTLDAGSDARIAAKLAEANAARAGVDVGAGAAAGVEAEAGLGAAAVEGAEAAAAAESGLELLELFGLLAL